MNIDVANSAVKDLRKLETKLTRDVKVSAVRAGWPKKLVNSLQVKVLTDEIVVTYPDQYADEIEDLEYGTRTTSPRSVFRFFMNKSGAPVADSIEASVMAKLAEKDS